MKRGESMIIYPTVKTADVFGAPLNAKIKDKAMKAVSESVISSEQGNALCEWGLKLFYLNGMKCLQAMNYASKFTVVLCNVRKADLKDVGNLIADSMLKVYEQDSETYEALVKIVRSHPIVAWDKMTNKTVLSSMNIIEEGFLTNPDFYDKFIDKNGNLDCLSMNTWLNFEYITSGAFVGSKKYIFPGELMKELVLKTQA